MRWLRHSYHKRFGRHGRFHLAVLFTRQEHILRHGVQGPVDAAWKLALNIVLVFLVVIVWMTVLPPGEARRR